jgi:cardiolipin synthase A/B
MCWQGWPVLSGQPVNATVKAQKKDDSLVTLMLPNNRITLLQNGNAFFPALEAALDRAQHEIYLETYIFENDYTGKRIAEALRRAAFRGVKTHLLVDGFGSMGLPKSLVDHIEAAGVRVLKFRPKTSPWTLRRRRLRRLHRKIVVVDQAIAFVGGINIIDDQNTPGQPSTRFDFAVCVEGPLVTTIRASTRRVWSRVTWTRMLPGWNCTNAPHFAATEPKGLMHAAFLVRNNIRHRRDIEDAYLLAIQQAQSEIVLASAYFLPGLNFRHALVDAAGRGVRVILLLQGSRYHRLLYFASHALYGSFLAAGIEIHEYHQSMLHAKVAVIDAHWSTIGSSNLDPFSLLLALEANVVVDDECFAKQLKHSLTQAIAMGARRISRTNWRRISIGLRLAHWLSYGVVRFMVGIAGYASGHRPHPVTTIDPTILKRPAR